MAKQVTKTIKVQVKGGQATPAPPVGTALGPHGVNIGQFVQQFNERTKDMVGVTVPVIITVYNDRSFEFVLKSPPAAVLIKQVAQIARGSSNPRTTKVGSISKSQVMDIAKIKLSDLNAVNLDNASRMIEGTARSMGVEVVD